MVLILIFLKLKCCGCCWCSL